MRYKTDNFTKIIGHKLLLSVFIFLEQTSAIKIIVNLLFFKRFCCWKGTAFCSMLKWKYEMSYKGSSWIDYCVKIVQIRSFFWSVFSRILNEYYVSFRIQSECGKIRTRKSSVFGHFSRSGHAVDMWTIVQNFSVRFGYLNS